MMLPKLSLKSLKALATPKTLALLGLGLAIALVVLQIVEDRRRRRRGEPFLPLIFGAATLGLGIGKFLGADKKVQDKIGMGGGGGSPARVNPVPNPACQYKTREPQGAGWGCPAGWRDTGADWDGGANGDKQCEQCGPAAPPPPPKVNPAPKAGCIYRTRTVTGKQGNTEVWGCPAGWNDTGANWDGGANGDKQCEQCPANAAACMYRTRVVTGKQGAKEIWGCPAGWTDTGKDWNMPQGEQQCMLCPSNPAKCKYSTRVVTGKQGTKEIWGCPAGWTDTGKDWGMPQGEQQCMKC